jgi:hypothetical protein
MQGLVMRAGRHSVEASSAAAVAVVPRLAAALVGAPVGLALAAA